MRRLLVALVSAALLAGCGGRAAKSPSGTSTLLHADEAALYQRDPVGIQLSQFGYVPAQRWEANQSWWPEPQYAAGRATIRFAYCPERRGCDKISPTVARPAQPDEPVLPDYPWVYTVVQNSRVEVVALGFADGKGSKYPVVTCLLAGEGVAGRTSPWHYFKPVDRQILLDALAGKTDDGRVHSVTSPGRGEWRCRGVPAP